jgi:hypothetical protein
MVPTTTTDRTANNKARTVMRLHLLNQRRPHVANALKMARCNIAPCGAINRHVECRDAAYYINIPDRTSSSHRCVYTIAPPVNAPPSRTFFNDLSREIHFVAAFIYDLLESTIHYAFLLYACRL